MLFKILRYLSNKGERLLISRFESIGLYTTLSVAQAFGASRLRSMRWAGACKLSARRVYSCFLRERLDSGSTRLDGNRICRP